MVRKAKAEEAEEAKTAETKGYIAAQSRKEHACPYQQPNLRDAWGRGWAQGRKAMEEWHEPER